MAITSADFDSACEALAAKCRQAQSLRDWRDVRVRCTYGITCLRIQKDFAFGPTNTDSANTTEALSNSSEDESDAIELTEEDSESLPPRASSANISSLTYDIIHSPTYQVPVLYIQSQPPLPSLPIHLIQPSYLSQFESVGVKGAVTMTDHPVSGLPVWFVHPCRTQEVMEGMLGERGAPGLEYLVLWLGVVGQGVGLSLPVEVAEVVVNNLAEI